MIELDGLLTTDDMAFAVVLILSGYEPVMAKDHKRVIWTLDCENEDEENELSHFVYEYHQGALRVEPRRYSRELAATRKDVYKLMGVGQQPQGTRVRRPS